MIEIKEKTKGILKSVLLIVGLLFIIFLIWRFSAIVTYVLISLVLSFIGKPLVSWITFIKYKRFKIPKGIAAFITLVILWIVLISFFRFIIPLIIHEFDTLSQIDFADVLQSTEEPIIEFLQLFSSEPVVLNDQTFFDIVTENVGERINFSEISDLFGVIAGTIGEVLIGFFSVSFITFFFLKESNMFREGIILLVPTDYETKAKHILDSSSYLLRRYFIGILFEVFMVMLLVTIGLSVVGVGFEHAVVIGLICGLFNIIPYLGPWMGAAVGLLIGAAINIDADFMSHTLPLLGFMVLVFGSVQILDNILFQPLIYSSSVKAHPLEIFIVILVAGSLAGILGMILAIPSYTIIRVIAKEFFDNMKIVKKLTENIGKENN